MKLTKAQRQAAALSSPAYELAAGPPVPHHLAKLPAHIARWPDVHLFGGITLIQPRLPSLLGQFGLTELRDNARRAPPMSPTDVAANNFAESASDGPNMTPIDDTPPVPAHNPGQHHRKRAAQWQQEVIPAILPHFAHLLQETKSLRDLGASCPSQSPCNCSTKLHKVTIVCFSTIKDLELQVCKCTPAAVQLMQVGAFSCAPILPSLAVDLWVLEYTMDLFLLQVALNNTAISITPERVLSNMGFQLDHQNTLRRRFGNCLMWYTHLRNQLKAKYNGVLGAVREVLAPQADVDPEEITPPGPPPPPPPCRRQAERSGPRAGLSSGTPTPPSPKSCRARTLTAEPLGGQPPPMRHRRPSPSHELLPGGGSATGNRRQNQRSLSPNRHRKYAQASTSADDVQFVLVICSMISRKLWTSPKYHPDTHFVPEDLAAKMEAYVDNTSKNETHRKHQARDVEEEEEEDGYEHEELLLPRSVLASTEFFEDTGLMVLLCRHDRVLWVVNMHSAGEKQFDVILLIERLFEHLPRKYHNCLYTLDAQIEHIDETSLLQLGHVQKHAEATKALRECGKAKTLLREQWKLQVLAQTKPLPRRTKNHARQGLVHNLHQKFLDTVMEEDPDAAMYGTKFKAAEKALCKLKELLWQKEAALGVDERQDLHELASSEYMRIRMNTRALKIRLQLCLHARKFELDPVERALQRLVNDSKLHAHTTAAVKRREPTITKLAGEYNKLLPIPAKGLWQLDVNDTIFQDIGLDDNDDGSTEPPLWLCNEQVQQRGCPVVAREVWFAEEWDIVSKATEDTESEVDKYHLRLHQDKLVRLCATWEKHLPNFGVSTITLPPWGPSTFQMVQCNVDAHLAAHGEDRHYREEMEGSDSEGDAGGEESGREDEDFATLDAVERADIYRSGQDDQ
ncbi:hypothetical protein B0H13DRAFT_2348424 [Mycena leptocephala]|nr:hypothetical protein B0H13DRAFT_2348424 [Mycena leptocephala]